MTTLDDLTRRREMVVPTPAGPVTLRTPSFARIAPLMELPVAEQAPRLIAACAVSPELTDEQAAELDTGVVMALLPACMELNGLGPAPD